MNNKIEQIKSEDNKRKKNVITLMVIKKTVKKLREKRKES